MKHKTATSQTDRKADETTSVAERRHANPTHERLTSVEAVLADAELSPPRKLELLTAWDERHGTGRLEGYGRVADAADLGFPDPAPYSTEVQSAIVELYRRHRADLPQSEEAAWNKGGAPDTP